MHIVVIGAGLAAAKAVEELRAQGYREDITVIGAESHPPYERPPLSKGLLLGTAEPASAFVHDAAWYAEHQVDLRTGTTASGVDLGRRRVAVPGGHLVYDRLLLATGAVPSRLPVPVGEGVMTLRSLDDALRLRARLTGRIVIVGAGWIGLEVAAAARLAGGAVTVVESAALPLERVLGAEVAPVFADLHRAHGVDLRLGTTVAATTAAGDATEVRLSDGGTVIADLILVGVGVRPDDRLAAQAGLAVDDGILVDARLRTSDAHVYAAGDVANHDHPSIGRIRVEHWDTAIHQGRHAARAMLGSDEPYVRQPYFFTDQYDIGMEYVGHVGSEGYDDVIIRGDPARRVMTAVWLRRDRVLAGMHLNDWDAIDAIHAWVGRDATAGLRDARIPLADVPR